MMENDHFNVKFKKSTQNHINNLTFLALFCPSEALAYNSNSEFEAPDTIPDSSPRSLILLTACTY